MNEERGGVRFREVQRFRQWWIWAILLGILLLFGYGLFKQLIWGAPWGDRPLPNTALAGITLLLVLFTIWFYQLRLVTEVRDDGLYVHFVWLTRRRKIPFSEIKAYAARTYHPLREYGGWGVRYGFKGKAYNVSGNRGVQLELVDGERLLVGSQRPEELVRAIEERMIIV